MAGRKVRWIDRDYGWKQAMREIHAAVQRRGVRVGIVGDKAAAMHPDAEMSVAALAQIHEFGMGVPERSFIRATMDINQKKILAEMRVLAGQVIEGKMTRKQANEILGRFIANLMRKMVAQGVPPPNSASVAKKKGHNRALVDTGTLFDAIDHEVTS
jgi:hypothetical protein